jgi:hypothetical protein
MDKELLQILIICSSSFLFALGGWKNKAWRRYVLPILLFILLLEYGIFWQNALVACVVLSVMLHLPYGERTPYWLKFLVGCSYVIPSYIITGYSIWLAILPLTFMGFFILSNWKVTEHDVPWKVWETLVGTCMGISLVV